MAKDHEQLPLVSGHFTDRLGLKRSYYDEPAVLYVKNERDKQSLDSKDLSDKIKLEVQHQLWLEKREKYGQSYPSQGSDSKTDQSQS
jgi:hypothetical protein